MRSHIEHSKPLIYRFSQVSSGRGRVFQEGPDWLLMDILTQTDLHQSLLTYGAWFQHGQRQYIKKKWRLNWFPFVGAGNKPFSMDKLDIKGFWQIQINPGSVRVEVWVFVTLLHKKIFYEVMLCFVFRLCSVFVILSPSPKFQSICFCLRPNVYLSPLFQIQSEWWFFSVFAGNQAVPTVIKQKKRQ